MDNGLLQVVKEYGCSVCDLHLSIPPIMIADLDSGNELYKCGRCQRINYHKYKWTRIRLFERMAQNLSFPCSYSPCTEILPWGELEQHEGNCCYKTIKCPLSKDCQGIEAMLVDQFGEHITEKHQGHITKADSVEDGWGYWVSVNGVYILFTETDGQYFVVLIYKWSRIAVMSTRCSKFTKFRVKLKLNEEDNFAVSVDNLPVIPYNNNINKISADDFTIDLSNNLTDPFSKLGRNSRIYIHVTFIAGETNHLDESTDEECEANEQNSTQLNVECIKNALTCPYCITYMAAPIFTCVTGHTVCNECKPLLKKCPTCQASLDGPRMYTLEEMAGNVKLPCQFKVNGCLLIDNASRLRTHELECSFGSDF